MSGSTEEELKSVYRSNAAWMVFQTGCILNIWDTFEHYRNPVEPLVHGPLTYFPSGHYRCSVYRTDYSVFGLLDESYGSGGKIQAGWILMIWLRLWLWVENKEISFFFPYFPLLFFRKNVDFFISRAL